MATKKRAEQIAMTFLFLSRAAETLELAKETIGPLSHIQAKHIGDLAYHVQTESQIVRKWLDNEQYDLKNAERGAV